MGGFGLLVLFFGRTADRGEETSLVVAFFFEGFLVPTFFVVDFLGVAVC